MQNNNITYYAVFFKSIVCGLYGTPGAVAIFQKEQIADEYADEMNKSTNRTDYFVAEVKIVRPNA